MKTLLASALRTTTLLTPLFILVTTEPAVGQTHFTLLQNLSTSAEAGTGSWPYCGVIRGSDGWLYGTALLGVDTSVAGGVVYKLQTSGAGFQVIHQFVSADGHSPQAAVLEASDGFLYGTTVGGGSANSGVVFKLAKDGSQFAVLHHFAGGADSAGGYGGLIEGSDGYLYGTTDFGDGTTRGTIYKLDKSGDHYAIIHAFTGNPDGQQCDSKLLRGSDGWLYGTTVFGGSGFAGTVFKLLENGGGYEVIRHFTSGTNGAGPIAGVIEASDGYLYGTTQLGGGVSSGGVVFKLEKSGANFNVIKSFAGSGTDLRTPLAELVEGANGLLYGSASAGGISNRGGIFRLNKDGSGYTVLRHFVGRLGGGDGDTPRMALWRVNDDLFYGTSRSGGESGGGSVFALSTAAMPPRGLQLTKTGNFAELQFSGTGSLPHTIESSTNLTTWTDLTTLITPIHGRTHYTNTLTAPATFFRVRLQQ